MNELKKPLIFTAIMIPIACIAGYFLAIYQLDMFAGAMLDEAIAEIGSKEMLIGVVILQNAMYAVILGFCGYLLSDKLGLIRSFRLHGMALKKSLLISVAAALLFSLDYWTFGAVYPEIQTADAAGLTVTSWIASILGGGIMEELMLRFFFMSLLAFLLWKIFFRKEQTVPTKVLIIANVIAALLFAAGHIPATILIFGELTPLILIRCFLFNGGAGLIFGYLFCKYVIQYAMLSHAMFHIVSKTVWTLFI